MNPDPQIPFWSREKLAAFARQDTQAAERAERIAVPQIKSKFLEKSLVLAMEMFAGKTAESTLLENASSAVGDFAPGNAGKAILNRIEKKGCICGSKPLKDFLCLSPLELFGAVTVRNRHKRQQID